MERGRGFRGKSFNPRPREGATTEVVASSTKQLVSIHAPVKGRLTCTSNIAVALVVSIHAPVKGRPHNPVASGGDTIVSIHAPVKGRL